MVNRRMVNGGMQRRLPPRQPPLTQNSLPHRSFFVIREKTCPFLLRVFTKVDALLITYYFLHGVPIFVLHIILGTSSFTVKRFWAFFLLYLCLYKGKKVHLSDNKVGSHHSKEDFAVRGSKPENEFQIYTWKDATLRELTELVKKVTPEAKRGFARLSFAFVFPAIHGHFVVRPAGNTFAYGNRKIDDDKALAELGFQIGDYLDVAIL